MAFFGQQYFLSASVAKVPSKLTTNTFILQIWSPDATAVQLVEKRELLREHAALYGHMEDFTPLFNRKFNK